MFASIQLTCWCMFGHNYSRHTMFVGCILCAVRCNEMCFYSSSFRDGDVARASFACYGSLFDLLSLLFRCGSLVFSCSGNYPAVVLLRSLSKCIAGTIVSNACTV